MSWRYCSSSISAMSRPMNLEPRVSTVPGAISILWPFGRFKDVNDLHRQTPSRSRSKPRMKLRTIFQGSKYYAAAPQGCSRAGAGGAAWVLPRRDSLALIGTALAAERSMRYCGRSRKMGTATPLLIIQCRTSIARAIATREASQRLMETCRTTRRDLKALKEANAKILADIAARRARTS